MTSRLAPDQLDALNPLLEATAFKPYRHYRTYSRRQQVAVLREEVRATLDHPDGGVFVTGSGGPEAAVVMRRLAWDSSFFGVPMGRLEYVLTGAAASPADAAAVIDAALAHARDAGVRHLSARVDVADLATIGALEARGFRLLDALVTYITRPGKDVVHDVRDVGRLRESTPADTDAIIAIAADAYHGYRGRFHLDGRLPADRADALYVEWARKTASREMAQMVLVAEDPDGTVIGFLGFQQREPVTSHGGTPVFGGGLGACRRDRPGAYAGLIRAGTVWAHTRGGVAECQTQNYNFPVIRIYEAVGAHYVRAEYTLHAWLD